jgi:Uma2 family endonuclease
VGTTLLTFAEFELLPEQPGKDELLDGELFHLPPAFHSHMLVVHRIFALLAQIVDGPAPERQRAFMETGYKIGHKTWLIPDVSVAHPDQTVGDYLEGAPAIAVEVISDCNTARQIERKRRIYLDSGALEVWVFFPAEQSAWVYARERSENFSDEFRSRVLPDLRIDLRELFE